MAFFADAFIPFTSTMPAAQVSLLLVIVLIEGKVIKSSFESGRAPGKFWSRILGVNCVTTALGLVLAFLLVSFEISLASSWTPQPNPKVRWPEVAIFGFLDPWIAFFICYQISWRTEYFLLNKSWAERADGIALKQAVRRAHRWSYALLALPVVVANYCSFDLATQG